MPVSREIIYKCDSCKQQRDKNWKWLGFLRPKMGQYYLPSTAIFCDRGCVDAWLKAFVDVQVGTVTPQLIEATT